MAASASFAFGPGERSPLLLLLLLLGASLAASASPPPAKLGCWFVEEAAVGAVGGGGLMPGEVTPRPALLVLPPPGQRLPEATLERDLPAEVEPGLAFQLLDPSGSLWSGREPDARPRWGRSSARAGEGPACEVNPYRPREAHVPWAAGLAEAAGPEGGGGCCPRSLDGRWVVASIQSPEAAFGVSSILHQEGPLPGKRPEVPRVATATARTPRVASLLGKDALLDCGFSAPATAFSVEWRYQHGGAGRVILAYDGAAQRMAVAEEGAQLFLEPGSSNVSLQLKGAQVRHEGTYICSVYLPHLQAQQAMELKIVRPPKVTLRPVPFPVPLNTPTDLACEIRGHYPPSVSVVWTWHSPGATPEVLLETWESGNRQAPDGTFSFTSFARLPALQSGDPGGSYSCHVSHVGLGPAGLRRTLKLKVAGSAAPSVEDLVGLFLVSFGLLGFLQLLSQRAVFGEKKEARTPEPSAQGAPPGPSSQAAAPPPEKGQGASKRQLSGLRSTPK
ncbi:tapasin [Pseudonaja textilis]|uniref:tapasin n=1 Tax=Pseudonaja textilis TaxID=8673 RepID=UPI000EA933B6|nr:tapasin [Pseudonaja textilis]